MSRRIKALFLCALMVVSLLAITACKKDGETKPHATKPGNNNINADGTVDYKVTVVNGAGIPYTEGMVVTFLSADGKESMAVVNAEGVASKKLAAGAYTVKVDSTNPDVVLSYDETAQVTAEAPAMNLVVAHAMGEQFETIYADSVTMEGNLPYDAYMVQEGSTAVTVTAEDRNYFLFVPTEAGKYTFSVLDNAATIGIYGATTNFIMGTSTEEAVDGKININITADMIGSGDTGTTVLVVGLDVEDGTTSCVLNVIRTGDPDWSVDQEPWSTYQPELEIKNYTLGKGITLKKFDLTASTDKYKLVLNEQDGCYHLNTADGPMVFVQLAEPMYGISMMDMVGEIVYDENGALMQTGTAPFRYMYDNGQNDFFKEDYTPAMRQFVTARDKASGVYPLTKDLYYILPKGIDQMGWCRSNTANYLFASETGINDEISWMFILMYEDAPLPENPDSDKPENPGTTDKPTTPTEKPTTPTTKPSEKPVEPAPKPDPIEDNKDEPIMIGGVLEFEAEVKANHIVYFDLFRYNDTTLTIKSKDAYVIYKGKTYEAKNGVVTVPDLYVQFTNQPIQIAIGNKGTADQTFDVRLAYPAGHMMNPYQLKEGSLTTKTAAGNEQGVFYTYSATSAGTLTIKLNSVTSGVVASVMIDCAHADDTVTQVSLEEVGGDTLSIDFKAGETIKVTIGAMPDKNNKYPAATITTTVTID